MTLTLTQAGQQLLVPAILWFFLIGAIFSLVVGIGLICASSRMFPWFNTMNRWISFREAAKPIAIPRDSWPFFERHRRWIAVVFIVAGLLSILNLILRLDLQKMIGITSATVHVSTGFIAWLMTSMWWLLLLGSALAVVVGAMLGFFPKAIARLEQSSGHWYSSRHVAKGAEVMHTPLDRLVARYPRALGAFIVIAALINLVVIAIRLF
jgi:hypothetical protein